ncbi:hypothetical protein [Streptomyces candidus]|uniref:Uncharacterized protein n=1 Tax=Streptomyces candidus TaxID=67283 RepID=A0A7X0HJ87_9ACTN|nr:hypothetical protein [Streptomyces candidus]MBB6438684.1 hypothetical protein [Streptomyces candidus]GHH45053.1 hypothetical protein GCM10018773_33680 [Streptomyces candidus]
MTTQPSHLTILLVPEHLADDSAPVAEESAVRSAVVEATGETGASGYPRYAGNGMVADIDPSTRTVEALLVDGRELDYGLSARVADSPDR